MKATDTTTAAIAALEATIKILANAHTGPDPDQEIGDAYHDLGVALRGTGFTENILGALEINDGEAAADIAWEEYPYTIQEANEQPTRICTEN